MAGAGRLRMGARVIGPPVRITRSGNHAARQRRPHLRAGPPALQTVSYCAGTYVGSDVRASTIEAYAATLPLPPVTPTEILAL